MLNAVTFSSFLLCFIIFRQSLSLAILTFSSESCIPSCCLIVDMLASRMERVESETLMDEVEEMSGRGEFSEGKRRGSCPLLIKCILLLLWDNY